MIDLRGVQGDVCFQVPSLLSTPSGVFVDNARRGGLPTPLHKTNRTPTPTTNSSPFPLPSPRSPSDCHPDSPARYHPLDPKTHNSWAEEPLQRGSYSYFPLGARDDDIHRAGQGATYGAPGAEPGAEGSERVFFAGEATVPGLEGSMHSAFLSGVRAVEDVAYAFGLPL